MADYKFIFRYGFTESWSETASQIVGASTSIALTDIETHSDENSVYVSWDGDDGSNGDGTKDYPYRTIQYARDMMLTGQHIITILDSNYYYTGDAIDLLFTLDGIVLQGAEGQKPILTIDTGIASQVYMIRLQNSGKLINVELQIPSTYGEQISGVDARSGTLKNITIDGANKNGIQKTTSGTVTVTNSIIKNSVNDGETDGSGILLQEGTLNIDYSLIHSNDYAGVRVSGSSSKVLAYDHVIIANNQYGTHETDATNLAMTIEDSIIYKNKIYDHYGSSAVISYTCIGKINGSPTLTAATNMLRLNPLFISNTDYRIRTKYNGYADNLLTSPCESVASDGTDMGCYQFVRSSTGQSYLEFEITPSSSYTPGKRLVDGEMVIVKANYPKIIKRGSLNTLALGWSGQDNALTNDEYTALELMFDNDNDEIYLSIDRRVTFTKYLIDKTKGISANRGLVKEDNTVMLNASLDLIEV